VASKACEQITQIKEKIMPKVRYNASKGLITDAGVGIDFTDASGAALRKKVVAVSNTSKTLTGQDSGALVALSGGVCTITLPTLALAGAGWFCSIYSASAHAHVVQANDTDTRCLQGHMLDGSNGTTIVYAPVTDRHKVTLANPRIGDRIDLFCDGTSFHTVITTSDTATLANS
jgi:hypothetical protein